MQAEFSHTSAADRAAGSLERRTVLQAALAACAVYAAAVRPVAAQTAVHTASDGLEAGAVTIDVNGFAMPAYRAMLKGGGKLPVVLVVSEIFGVHAYIADVVRRLAQQGYLAIAPELFVRQGDAGSYTDIPTLLKDVIVKVPDAQVMADLDATVRWAAQQGGDTQRLGITGFCWGGRITWLYTAHNPQVRAGVAWYGKLAGAPGTLQPQQPVDQAGKLHGPVLGLYGGKDEGIPLATVEQMQAALKQAAAQGNAAARQSRFHVYPDAGHAFHADYRPSYRKPAADDGWARMLAWFDAHSVR